MAKARKRLLLACDACRSRRTKCDGRRPSCNPCSVRGLDCFYQAFPSNPGNRLESELTNISERLDQLTSLLTQCHRDTDKPNDRDVGTTGTAELSCHENSPFRLLATSSIMLVLGLEADFAQKLIHMERSSYKTSVACGAGAGGGPQLFLVPQQKTISALAAFSDRIHPYYPILPLDFSEEFFRVLSEPTQPSCRSCLVLLVAAIGSVVQDPPTESSSGPYFEAALASLPLVIAECSVVSVQCLLLLAIYYCTLLKPFQAHDYCLMASFQIQNIFKIGLEGADVELAHRLYWAVLLLESELSVQLDVAKSSIWTLDDHIPLPCPRQTWQFTRSPTIPVICDISPVHASCIQSIGSTGTDQAQSFFLAEIAMRRMLHRCNSAVTRRWATKQYTYAPSIALELERQLDQWYNYLPGNIRFTRNVEDQEAHTPRSSSSPPSSSLSIFLRVQYYCCRISIYWPAVYQAMQDGDGTLSSPSIPTTTSNSSLLLEHCQRFFDSYVQLIPSITAAFQECLIYRWTLFLSIFITTLAAVKAATTPCLSSINLCRFYRCLASVARTDWAISESSRSLETLQYTLKQRLIQGNYHLNGNREGEDGGQR